MFSGIPLGFSSRFLLGSFPGIVPRIFPKIPLKIILVFLSFRHSGKFRFLPVFLQIFFYRPKDSPGFETGILLGIPFDVSPEIFIKISPGIPSEVPPGIPSDSPP